MTSKTINGATAFVAKRKRWVECVDARHAIYGSPAYPGDEVITLCAATALVVAPVAGRPAPECPTCDARWRQIEGIEQRKDHVPVLRRVVDVQPAKCYGLGGRR